MIEDIYLGDKKVREVFLGEELIYTKPPLIEANFLTNEYKLEGKRSTFEEIFEFSRAGKAWMVTDLGLQEYLIDKPRIDKGLLIETQTTNEVTIPYLNINRNGLIITQKDKGNFILEVQTDWKKDQLESLFNEYPVGYPTDLYGKYISCGFYIYNTNTQALIAGNGVRGSGLHIGTEGLLYYPPTILNSTSSFRRRIGLGNYDQNLSRYYANRGEYLEFSHLYYYVLNSPDYNPTPIINDIAKTTRPSDYLLLKNEYSKAIRVKGDWDITLELEIVEGQLLHTGYGKIRRLEIY